MGKVTIHKHMPSSSGPPAFIPSRNLGTVTWELSKDPAPSSSSPPPQSSQENPPATVAPTAQEPSEEGEVAFLDVDPTLMMLTGFTRVLVEGRQKFARVVTARARSVNEDLAIVTVSNHLDG